MPQTSNISNINFPIFPIEKKNRILSLVREFNQLIKPAIDGPNCIDPNVCDGNCCFIHIDVPRVLIEYYLERNFAEVENFERGSIFSFQIAVNLDTLRCVFYDKKLNGCLLHQTGMKPPQCWVYPTGLDLDDVKTTCKKAEGWSIIKPENVMKAKKCLEEYVKLSKEEGIFENSEKKVFTRLENLRLSNEENERLYKISPKALAGIEDGWDSFSWMTNEGYNMALQGICNKVKEKGLCDTSYLECEHICDNSKDEIFDFLKGSLPSFIKERGFKKMYSFSELIHR